ncbi:unnamed protein product [Closterium sp. NIES-54]
MPTRKLNSVRKLGTPSVSQMAEAALRAAEQTGSHGCVAAADAGRHQGLHSAWRHRDQHHLLRYLQHRCRRLHRLRHRLHGLHRCHRRPYPQDHPRHYLHLLHRFLHRPLHHPCFPCPCQCGAAH